MLDEVWRRLKENTSSTRIKECSHERKARILEKALHARPAVAAAVHYACPSQAASNVDEHKDALADEETGTRMIEEGKGERITAIVVRTRVRSAARVLFFRIRTRQALPRQSAIMRGRLLTSIWAGES